MTRQQFIALVVATPLAILFGKHKKTGLKGYTPSSVTWRVVDEYKDSKLPVGEYEITLDKNGRLWTQVITRYDKTKIYTISDSKSFCSTIW